MEALFRTISQRRRPEDVAQMILETLGDALMLNERRVLDRAAVGSLKRALVKFTSMMEDFARPVAPERQVRYEFTRIGKSSLAGGISCEEFSRDQNSGCFIAYYVSRCNLRSEFTTSGQQRPYDKIADMLFERCKRRRDEANWWAIAHVFPDSVCFGKVLRLMAADVAAWHRLSGGDLDPDTKVWREVPLPWEVLSGDAGCTRAMVEAICHKHGVDPVKKGWTASTRKKVAEFRPTPELVHG